MMHSIHGGTFPYDVMITVGTTKEWILSHVERKYGYSFTEDEKELFNFSSTISGKIIFLSNNVQIIWLAKWDIVTLVHELLHATCFILQKSGVPISQENDEVMTYLQQHLLIQSLKLEGKFKKTTKMKKVTKRKAVARGIGSKIRFKKYKKTTKK